MMLDHHHHYHMMMIIHHHLTSIFQACTVQLFCQKCYLSKHVCLWRHPPSFPSNTLQTHSFISLLTQTNHVFLPLFYQPYLPPSTADSSSPSHHQTSSPHVQTISIYYVLKPDEHCINFHTTQKLIRCHSTPQSNTTHPPHHHLCALCIPAQVT